MTFATVCRVMEFTSVKLRQTVQSVSTFTIIKVTPFSPHTTLSRLEIVTKFLVREIFIMSRRNCYHLPENVFPQAKNSEKLFRQKIQRNLISSKKGLKRWKIYMNWALLMNFIALALDEDI